MCMYWGIVVVGVNVASSPGPFSALLVLVMKIGNGPGDEASVKRGNGPGDKGYAMNS